MQITPIFLLKHYFCIPLEHKDPQIPQKYTRRDRHPCLAVEIVWGVWCISRGQVKRLIWGDTSHCAGFLPSRKQISSVLIPETWTARLHYISPRHYTIDNSDTKDTTDYQDTSDTINTTDSSEIHDNTETRDLNCKVISDCGTPTLSHSTSLSEFNSIIPKYFC